MNETHTPHIPHLTHLPHAVVEGLGLGLGLTIARIALPGLWHLGHFLVHAYRKRSDETWSTYLGAPKIVQCTSAAELDYAGRVYRRFRAFWYASLAFLVISWTLVGFGYVLGPHGLEQRNLAKPLERPAAQSSPVGAPEAPALAPQRPAHPVEPERVV